MSTPINLPDRKQEMVRKGLAQRLGDYDSIRVMAFGSRVSGRAKDKSDLDLAVEKKGLLSFETLWALREDFQESDIPIKVDILEMNRLDPDFRLIVEREAVPFWKSDRAALRRPLA